MQYKIEKVLQSLDQGIDTYKYYIVNEFGIRLGEIYSEKLALFLKDVLE